MRGKVGDDIHRSWRRKFSRSPRKNSVSQPKAIAAFRARHRVTAPPRSRRQLSISLAGRATHAEILRRPSEHFHARQGPSRRFGAVSCSADRHVGCETRHHGMILPLVKRAAVAHEETYRSSCPFMPRSPTWRAAVAQRSSLARTERNHQAHLELVEMRASRTEANGDEPGCDIGSRVNGVGSRASSAPVAGVLDARSTRPTEVPRCARDPELDCSARDSLPRGSAIPCFGPAFCWRS